MSQNSLPWDWYSKIVPSSNLQQHAVMQVEQSPVPLSGDVSSPAVNADGSHKQQAPVAATTVNTQQPALPLPADGISGGGKKQTTGSKREKKPSSGSGVAATGETEIQQAPEPKLYKRLRKKYSSPVEKEKQEQIKEGKSVAVESTEQQKKYSSPEEKEKQEHIKKGKSVAVESTEQQKKYSNPEEKEKHEQIKKGKMESAEQRKKYSSPEEKEKQEKIKKGKSIAVESEQKKTDSNPDEKETQEQINKKGEGVAVESTEPRKLRPRRAATEDKQQNKGQNVSTSPLKVADKKANFKNNFSLTLTKKEIEEDFLAMTGQKPPHKPMKRPKAVSKHMDEVMLRGKTLYTVHPKTYAVKEEIPKKAKSFKQRFDEYIRSCEYFD